MWFFPVGNVGLRHGQVWWYCDTGAPPDGISAPGRILISVRCSAPSKVIPKTENFMEEELFSEISKVFHSNPVGFLSQRVQMPSRCQGNTFPTHLGKCTLRNVSQEGVRGGIGFAVGL